MISFSNQHLRHLHLMEQQKKTTAKKKKSSKKTSAKFKIPHTHKPLNLTVQQWQTALRKQIAKETNFEIVSDSKEVYSDYLVKNTTVNNQYKVAIRSKDNSKNFCTCYDFKTNQLGTCKHVEAVFNYINKKPALKKLLKIELVQNYSSIYIDYKKAKKLRLRIGIEENDKLTKLFQPFVNSENELNEYFLEQADKIIPKAAKIQNEFVCYEDAMEIIIAYREEANRIKFVNTIKGKNQLPKLNTLKAKLFPYQKQGVRFIVKAGKCILADDMGLGKTLQAITANQVLHEYFGVQSVIIICPTSLKYQWQTEIEKFTKSKCLVIEGHPSARKIQYLNTDYLYKIVSYHSAANDIQIINDAQPDSIVLDEAQRIKNWQTKLSSNIKKLKSQYKLVLTGTPLENRIQDLYSLIQFIRPTDLESLYTFSNKYETRDESGKLIGYKNLHEVAEFIAPFLLRRRKTEVLQELPLRTDKNQFVTLTKEQRELHDYYTSELAKIIARWRSMRFLREEDRMKLMILLGNMRMVCNSTFILDLETNYQTKIDELFVVLDQILDTSDEKIVIFSQWERFTRLIASILDQKKIGYANLHGKILSKNRKVLFDRFNNDADCKIFLSTDAGGVGLNLQAASHVINMDIPWNPAVLEQRIARVYRYGQTKNVSVLNFVAQNTIEHGMLSRLKFKSALASGILDNGDANIFMNEEESKSFMESVSDLMTTDAMQKNVYTENVVEDINDYSFKDEIVETEAGLESKTECDTNTINYPNKKSALDDNTEQKIKDEIAENEKLETVKSNPLQANVTTNANEFMQQASSFFGSLSAILSDPIASENLVKSISKKDEATGQTYLQIPVANDGVIKNVVGLLAGLFKGS
jgi:SNF2 family DNA or RNA helicase